MLDLMSADRAIELLGEALDQNTLPARVAGVVRSLRDQLQTPVRVTFLGPCTAGKRALVNAFAGAEVIPPGLGTPTLEVSYGTPPEVRATMGDGSRRTLPGASLTETIATGASFLQVVLPEPRLQHITLLDLVTDGTPHQTQAAAKWASRRSTIAIWVTASFDAAQRRLWEAMPDALKHHCFLAVTAPEDGGDRMGPAHNAVANGLFIDAFRIGLDRSTGAATGQGTLALHHEVLQCAEIGRQSDLDQAAILLKRHAHQLTLSTRRDDLAPTQAQPVPADAPAHAATYDAALATLRSGAQAILDQVETDPDFALSLVTARCAEAIEEVSDMLPAGTPLHEMSLQASDYLVLLQLEDDEAAAGTAAAALLQLKRDVEVAAAAA